MDGYVSFEAPSSILLSPERWPASHKIIVPMSQYDAECVIEDVGALEQAYAFGMRQKADIRLWLYEQHRSAFLNRPLSIVII